MRIFTDQITPNQDQTNDEKKEGGESETVDEKCANTVSEHRALMVKYGALLQGLDFERLGKKVAIRISLVQFAKKIAIGLSVVSLANYPGIAVMVLVKVMLFDVCFILWYMPYVKRWDNIKAILNEFTLLLISYFQLCLSQFTSTGAKPTVGNWLLILIGVSVLANLLIFIGPRTKSAYLYIKRFYLHNKCIGKLRICLGLKKAIVKP